MKTIKAIPKQKSNSISRWAVHFYNNIYKRLTIREKIKFYIFYNQGEWVNISQSYQQLSEYIN